VARHSSAEWLATSRSPFNAREIATPVDGAERVRKGEYAQAAYERLVALDYDQAPVEDRGQIVGWVRTESLPKHPRVSGALQALSQTALVAEEAPVDVAIAAVARRRFAFTIGDDGISGFITPADLDKHAVRGHLFLLVSAVEMSLSDVVEQSCSDGAVMDKIRGNAETNKRWTEAKRDRLDLRPVEYLYLEDLARLFLDHLALDVPGWDMTLENQLTELCQIRPAVMHPTRPLLGLRAPAQLATTVDGGKKVIRALARLANATQPA